MSLQWHHGEQTGPQWNTPVLQEDMVATKVDVAITSLGSMKEAVVQHSATKCDNISSCWAEFGLVFRFRWWIGWRSSHVSNLCSIWLCAVLLEAWCLDCLTKHFIHPWFWNILEGFGIHWSVQVGPILTKRCTEQTSITVRGFFLLQLQVPTLHWTVAFVWQAGLEAVPALLPCCLGATGGCNGCGGLCSCAGCGPTGDGKLWLRKAAEWGEIGMSPPKTGPFIRKKNGN